MRVNKILNTKYNEFIIIGNGAVGSFLHSLLDDSFRLLGKKDPLEISDNSLIIIATKAYDLENILSQFNRTHFPEIILVQNGYLDDIIAPYPFAFFRLLLDFGIEKENNEFQVHGTGAFYTDHYAVYQMLMSKAATYYCEDTLCMRWKKLITNSVINPISALYNVKNKDIFQYDTLIMNIIDEGLHIANVFLKPELTYKEAHDYVCSVMTKTGSNSSSMLQDIHKRKKTEIECINGALIRLGKHYGMSVSTNQLLYDQVKNLEKSYLCSEKY